MKKATFIILLFLIPIYCFSQASIIPIDSFIGIKLGSDAATVKAGALANGGKFSAENSQADFLFFKDITFGTRKNVTLIVKLVDNKAYEAHFVFDNEQNAKCITYYNDLVKDINVTYGPGQVHKDFTEPYKDGDGQETEAIKSGNAQYITVWSDYKNGLEATIEKSLQVNLVYQDSALYDVALQKLKKD